MSNLIDVTRPQDYMFRNYDAEIKAFFINPGSAEDSDSSIFVLFLREQGYFDTSVSKEGKFYVGATPHKLDVILRPETAAQPQETKKRKVVQITNAAVCTPCGNIFWEQMALCDDGAMFVIYEVGGEWTKLPEIPQD